MTISGYLENVKTLMLTNPLVESFQVVRERITVNDGHIRARMKLVNGCLMEFSEYVQRMGNDVQVITYSYHCTDSFHRLVVRWDNTPRFPDLEGFPHHRHTGYPETVQAGQPMNIFKVFDGIMNFISAESQES